MNPRFKCVASNDAKDLVNFIIMKLHEELNKIKKNNNASNISNIQIVQTNKLTIFKNFFINFVKENQSIIRDLFYSANIINTQCSGYKITKYNFQSYYFLIFPLEEIRKFKIEKLQHKIIINSNQNMLMNLNNPMMINMDMNQNMMIMNNPIIYQQFSACQKNLQNNISINLHDCFEYNQKIKCFYMYCNICKNQLPASYRTFLYTTPEILIIILNRGRGIEFNVKTEFTESLNLYNYVERKETGYMYKLIGVVTHMDESGANRHFIAFCKSPINNKWYKYNDNLVSEVFNIKQEIIEYDTTCMLFSEKINNNF